MTGRRKKAAFFAVFMIACAVIAGWALGDVQLSGGAQMYFVPPASQTQTQRYTLAVRGLERGEVGEPPRTVEYLPGAVFGIYAPDAEGNMQPWPDPRAPQSPYLIRTETEPVSFDLPDGMAFFVRQERAPEGFLPMPEGYWSIEGQTDLRVDNAMPGGLEIRAVSTDGEPVAGARIRISDGEQLLRDGQTGADGVWRVDSLPAGAYAVEDAEPPKDFLPAQDGRRDVSVQDAAWAGVTFVHQRMGRLLVLAESAAVRPDGQAVRAPLSDVGLQVLDENRRPVTDPASGQPIEWNTDANGLAQGALPAGTYVLRVTRQPQGAPELLAEETSFVVTDGQDTELTLTAAAQEGYVRFAISGEVPDAAGIPLAGVRCVLERDGARLGEYVTDGAGLAVTSALAPGEYIARYDGLPEGYVLPEALEAGQTLVVKPAALLENAVVCPPVLTGRWTVCVGVVGERGDVVEMPVGEAAFMVLQADGTPVTGADGVPMQANADAGGMLELTLPAGEYLLQPLGGQAALSQAQEQPVAFALPQVAETVILPGRLTRLVLNSVRQDGARLGGSSYRLLDEKNNAYELTADDQGRAVSPALEPGNYRVETLRSAEGYGPAEAAQVACQAGVPQALDMVHLTLGRLEARLLALALNAQGEADSMPLSGVRVGLVKLADGGDPADTSAYDAYPTAEAPLILTTDAQGVARDVEGALPALPAGIYRSFGEALPGFADAGLSEAVEVADGQFPTLEWTTRSEEGGVLLALRDAEDSQRPLADAAFVLAPLAGGSSAEEPLTLDEQGQALRVQLPQGQYRLRQTHWPEGYDPLPEQMIEVSGGTLTEVILTNARRGTLSVDKQGFTFDAEMQPFRVPLRGAYAVYTLMEGAYQPYPSQEEQLVVTANGMAVEGGSERVELPATMEGLVYYLCELEGAVSPGYVADAEYHEARVFPGRHTTAEIAAVADKGFFVLRHLAAEDEQPLTGGSFALYAKAGERDGAPVWESEPALTFEVDGPAYQNEMALPVGDYRLVLRRAPQGAMLDADLEPVEQIVRIPAYVRRGNPMAQVEMRSVRAPRQGDPPRPDLPLDGAAQELRFEPADAQGDILAVTVGAARAAQGAPVSAQVAYRLAAGGWNWGDVRQISGLEQGAQTVDLSDVSFRVVAVRIRYVNGSDGAPQLGTGFSAEEARLTVAAPHDINAISFWDYESRYRDELGERQAARIQSQPADALFERLGDRALRPEGQARASGGIGGSVRRMRGLEGWEGDGRPDQGVAGARVLLERIDAQGATVQVAETAPDERGAYAFSDVPFGTYRVRFAAPEGDLIAQVRDGGGASGDSADASADFALSADQSWHWAQAGIVRAAGVSGSLWLDADLDAVRGGEERGASGIRLTLLRGENEVASAVTGEDGSYAFTGLLPGGYTLRAELPDDILYTGATPEAARAVELELGERLVLPEQPVVLAARLAGSLLADGGTRGVSSAKVELLREGLDQPLHTATTDEQGGFSFDRLTPGAYRLRIALPAAYAFPREPAAQEGLLTVRDAARGETDSFTLAMGEARDGLRVEALRPAKVTVTAWEDRGYQGTRGEGDAGVPGVKVALAPLGMPEEEAAQLAWQTTGPDGIAEFERLEPGTYELWYELPAAWRLTRQVDDQGKALPMRRGASGRGQSIALSDGQRRDIGIGLVLPAALRGAAWLDANDNGLWDAGEAPYAGAEVRLDDPSGMLEPMRVLTDERGAYRFDEMPPGSYRLSFALPEGHVYAANADPVREIQLAMGQVLENESMGLVETAEVSGVIWEDADNSGEMNEAETGAPGTSVALYRLDRGQRTLVLEQKVGEDGAFAFTGLRPGTYQMDCALPAGYVVVRATDTTLRFNAGKKQEPMRSDAFALFMGGRLEGVKLAVLRLGSLSGSVWEDSNFDGLRGQEEHALSKVTVALWRSGHSEPAAAVTTGKDGAYRFDELPPGDYQLRFTLPEGLLFTRASEQSMPDAEGREAVIPLALAMGQSLENLNAGALMPAAMSGLVWIDENDDGMLDANEPAVAGAAVRLVPVDDPDHVVVTATSDAQGRWRAENIMPRVYLLKAGLPEGYLFATAPKRRSETRAGDLYGVDASEAVSQPIALKAGQRVDNFQIGGIPAALIEGSVWLDEDDDGLLSADDPAQSEVAVTLLQGGAAVSVTQTDEQGGYRFENLRPGAYVIRFELPDGYLFARAPKNEAARPGLVSGLDAPKGECAVFSLAMGQRLTGQSTGALIGAAIEGRVWLDPDESGAWDDGEDGLAGALVECVTEDGEVLRSARTGNDGSYRFDNLRPGAYRMRISVPEGDLLAPQAAEVLELLDDRQGLTEAFALEMGEETELPEIAALHGSSVGGLAWEDADVNGLLDSGEAPLTGAKATLLRQEGDDWAVLGTREVNDQGQYRFDGLRPGAYKVRFTLPSDFLFTDRPTDAQGRRSAVPAVSGQTGEGEPVQLTMGEEATEIHVGAIRPGMLGDTAWVDENGNGLQDYGEPPLPGVTLTLVSVQGGAQTEIATIQTDQYGFYRFDTLRPGLYRLRVTLPEGYGFAANRADLPEIDSDVPEGAGPAGDSVEFVVRSGQARRDIDIGARRNAQ